MAEEPGFRLAGIGVLILARMPGRLGNEMFCQLATQDWDTWVRLGTAFSGL
jgi:Fe-S cluster biosynthesis and repair protein YggX